MVPLRLLNSNDLRNDLNRHALIPNDIRAYLSQYGVVWERTKRKLVGM